MSSRSPSEFAHTFIYRNGLPKPSEFAHDSIYRNVLRPPSEHECRRTATVQIFKVNLARCVSCTELLCSSTVATHLIPEKDLYCLNSVGGVGIIIIPFASLDIDRHHDLSRHCKVKNFGGKKLACQMWLNRSNIPLSFSFPID